MTRSPLPPPLLLPASGGLPIVLSVPHSGRDYPPWLLSESRRGLRSLEPLEVPLVDRLAWRGIALGLPAIIARAPRAAIDCNRSPNELDPATISMPPGADPGPRALGGLGLVPGRTPKDGDLWRRKLSMAEVEQRKAEAWTPYHQAIGEALSDFQRRFGEVLLLDCHSMPPRGPRHPPVVIGDRHGRSAARWLSDLAGRTVEEQGFKVAFNEPYAGGWIVEHHGRPGSGIHALQLEIDRGHYLDRAMRSPGPEFDRMATLLETLARALGDALLDRVATTPVAAE